METRVIATTYQIASAGESDTENLFINVEITKGADALAGVTEEDIVYFVRGYLQSLTTNPIEIQKTQTVKTVGL